MRIWDKVLRRLPKVKTTQKTTSLRKSWGGALEAKNSKSPTEPRWGYCFQCDAGQYACSPISNHIYLSGPHPMGPCKTCSYYPNGLWGVA